MPKPTIIQLPSHIQIHDNPHQIPRDVLLCGEYNPKQPEYTISTFGGLRGGEHKTYREEGLCWIPLQEGMSDFRYVDAYCQIHKGRGR